MRSIADTLAEMTLEEKAALCSGQDFWNTRPIDRLDVPALMLSDGPHGLRKQPDGPGADHAGLLASLPATCFPTAAGLASSWDTTLLTRLGEALGDEAQSENVSVVLGPGTNIKRSPLCGRNFEYFSEDPVLSSRLASAHIQGVQSKGVGASLKHFAANNQEHRRMSVDARIDERTLREIYLASFEEAVKVAKPWTVMCAYNRVNGPYCSEHSRLLTQILRKEWGFDGIVVSDWAAVNDRVAGLDAGLELEMPTSGDTRTRQIVKAVESGTLSEGVLDQAVERLLAFIERAHTQDRTNADVDLDEHHQLARHVARESMVLLKNDGVLPLSTNQHVAVIGEFAERPRFQGGGSSHVNPYRVETPLEALSATGHEVRYAKGFEIDRDDTDQALLDDAVARAKRADVAVLFLGLPERYESEGYDRTHLDIPANQRALIDAVHAVQPNTVVVLANGSPVAMPWLSKASAVLEAYLGGQAVGAAVADLLFGEVSPCGKLAETFPHRLEDTPCYLHFPGTGDVVEYAEGIFVGYRYFDAKNVAPLFPFGHGLSYTTFTYQDLTLSEARISADDTLDVTVRVTNSGQRAGKEIVQLYVSDHTHAVPVAPKALRGFEKVHLEPGESATLTFTLGRRDFAYFDVDTNDWRVPTGSFSISFGASSADLRLTQDVHVTGDAPRWPALDRNTLVGDLSGIEVAQRILHDALAPLAAQNPLLKGFAEDPIDDHSDDMIEAMMRYLPLRGLVSFTQGAFDEAQLERLLQRLEQSRSSDGA
ncbi:glycoside hydrolase family 3 C-terminal domain-containing protein [Larsenimonas suaedae]|uniref:Glycoside hydrolase family 3 C-terminal domain-containing protein n=1 Tax=Larsenimonas suaedae TaxID=1851019 RepID=A0ABU1GRA7_9GAMM|nr:glycoside hydrolase family 3 C-terminal domain-containing protein [Larsenimonas suaedae]MCM2972640.1 glycoside hydrolase family 3 C-terminal domain-containing protein [Larsenimonas suaedae]MDR5894563.1 glycoside hydrolase family 3 C-terminal domain-containing protein [Larsenimonas suaedae]